MSVHKKLQQARIKLQSIELKKSGVNKFAGFQYFELGDFLPTVQSIFAEIGLGSSIKFNSDMAELTIIDTDAPHNLAAPPSVIFTCPVVVPTMKGCNEIQALGAMMTYIRRYLYVNALEIVEHDAIDATTGQDKGVQDKKEKLPTISDEQAEKHYNAWIEEKLELIDADGHPDNEVIANAWGKMPSNVRSAIKRYASTLQTSMDADAQNHMRSML